MRERGHEEDTVNPDCYTWKGIPARSTLPHLAVGAINAAARLRAFAPPLAVAVTATGAVRQTTLVILKRVAVKAFVTILYQHAAQGSSDSSMDRTSLADASKRAEIIHSIFVMTALD
jgi:hypothetical protein